MRITAPQDTQPFAPGAGCDILGVLQFADPTIKVESLRVLFRVYSAGKTGFLIAQEGFSTLDKSGPGKNLYSFKGRVKLPTREGTYLLKADCLNPFERKYPQSLIASQSVFIEVAKAKGNTVTISTPTKDTAYGQGSDITVIGTSTAENVVQIRIRFVKGTTIHQETVVFVAKDGTWQGVLVPPSGGWPVNSSTIQAQGLDKNGEAVGGELGSVPIKINPSD